MPLGKRLSRAGLTPGMQPCAFPPYEFVCFGTGARSGLGYTPPRPAAADLSEHFRSARYWEWVLKKLYRDALISSAEKDTKKKLCGRGLSAGSACGDWWDHGRRLDATAP